MAWIPAGGGSGFVLLLVPEQFGAGALREDEPEEDDDEDAVFMYPGCNGGGDPLSLHFGRVCVDCGSTEGLVMRCWFVLFLLVMLSVASCATAPPPGGSLEPDQPAGYTTRTHKVPILGSLPLLGPLFRQRTSTPTPRTEAAPASPPTTATPSNTTETPQGPVQ